MRYSNPHKGSKTRSENYHFRIRCIERLGFVPDKDELIKLIKDHKLELFDRQSHRVTRWVWPHKGKEYVIVYDSHRHNIVTVLFKDLCVKDEGGYEDEEENTEGGDEAEEKSLSPEDIERLSRITIRVS